MTNKEAVETLREEFCKLKVFCELYPDACQKENCDIYLAIEVLKGKDTVSPSIDTISRRAAIDAIEKAKTAKSEDGEIYVAKYNAEMNITLLPSAQPEIIRCKDCKHFEYDHLYIIQGMPVLGHEVCNAWGDGCKTDKNGYCFMAERRTDD